MAGALGLADLSSYAASLAGGCSQWKHLKPVREAEVNASEAELADVRGGGVAVDAGDAAHRVSFSPCRVPEPGGRARCPRYFELTLQIGVWGVSLFRGR